MKRWLQRNLAIWRDGDAELSKTLGGPVLIQGTVGENPPSAEAGGLLYRPNEGEANKTLSELFPSVSGVNRVYARARATSLATEVFVSHA